MIVGICFVSCLQVDFLISGGKIWMITTVTLRCLLGVQSCISIQSDCAWLSWPFVGKMNILCL